MNKNNHFKAILIFILLMTLINLNLAINLNNASASIFTEDFSTTTYKDNVNTSADWNTVLGKLRLPPLNWTRADGATPGYDNISNNSGDSWHPQIVLDSSKKPNVVWCDYGHGNNYNVDILFSKYTGAGGFSPQAQGMSTKINTTTENIIKATLTANHNLNGQSIYYYLSANGGTNWELVTPNAVHTFVNKGNNLRWAI